MTSASATTEQKINGQIGHPAACMIESKVSPRGDRRLCERIIADAHQRLSRWLRHRFLTLSSPPQGVHRFCGQLCGQPGLKLTNAAPFHATPWFAEFLGSIFFMQINHLHDHDSGVTRCPQPPGCRAALVDFPAAPGCNGHCH